jgi:hypothetical protein
MDHEAFEKEMIDGVNHNCEEKRKQHNISYPETKVSKKMVSLLNKNDKRILVMGIKRTLLALLTAAMFALSVICFVAVATTPGYLAVALFFMGLVTMGCAFVLLYAQGIINKTHYESGGEIK